MKPELHLWMMEPKSSRCNGCTHSANKLKMSELAFSVRRLMTAVLWERNGVLMVEFMQQGTTIISEVYCETINKLRRGIQNKRRGMLTCSIVFFHDNERLHTASRIWVLIKTFNWELFDRPSYSPDVAPSNYHLFTYLNNCLGSQFNNNKELMESVKPWLSTQAADCYNTGTQQLIPWHTCRNACDNYVENELKCVEGFRIYKLFSSLFVLSLAHRMLLCKWHSY
jgi:histone-lysine N-methyltransferase SETMAR